MATGASSYLEQQIERGIFVLKRGGVVAFPTDTVYGLGASIEDSRALERVYSLKGRPSNRPLPLLLAKTSQINEVAYVPQIAWQLAYRFLPGALTIVLPKKATVSDLVTAGSATVAVRVPDHQVPQTLVEGLGAPIVGTSANLSGRPAALTAGEVFAQFDARIDLVIDGGPCSGGGESTIIDLSGEKPRILREGALSVEKIQEVCKDVVIISKRGGA